ncbi:MAG: VCBS repeat-containing protein [Bacteroidales bacterium]|nr:VCBS repeat-containing protein [Bacteroidales bacterium]MDD3701044.1 VCBS repeat-containing protein [Bacteroidales bacterium]
MRYVVFLFQILMFSHMLSGQTFTDIRAGLTGVAESSSQWIDADRDGDPDIFVSGEHYHGGKPAIEGKYYNNLRNDRFISTSSGLPHFYRGDIRFADFDLDGIADAAVVGETKDGVLIAELFRGTGNGNFIKTQIPLIPVRDGSIDFADMDGDGDPDILIAGESAHGPITMIFRNDRNNRFTAVQAGLIGIRRGVARWTDFNVDGLPDIFVCGIDAQGKTVSQLYQNTGQGFQAIKSGILPLKNCNVAFGDFDNDGDDDLIILGETAAGVPTTILYRNNRDGSFTQIPADLAQLTDGFADWGDMDLDGDLDLLLSGMSANGAVSKVYRNDRQQGFTDIRANLIPLYNSSGQWGDYDLDGDLDILIAGLSNRHDFIARVYKNGFIGATPKPKKESASKDMWIVAGPNPTRNKPIYYYVYSSAYTLLDQEKEKRYYTFVSPVKRFPAAYVLEEKFNELIIQAYPNWSTIDQGNIIQNGFATQAEADKSRSRIIHEYKNKGFIIKEIHW